MINKVNLVLERRWFWLIVLLGNDSRFQEIKGKTQFGSSTLQSLSVVIFYRFLSNQVLFEAVQSIHPKLYLYILNYFHYCHLLPRMLTCYILIHYFQIPKELYLWINYLLILQQYNSRYFYNKFFPKILFELQILFVPITIKLNKINIIKYNNY